MATAQQPITVLVERPPETTLGDFLAEMRAWLGHHCVVLANFKGITSPTKHDIFEVTFDNARDAQLFERRFADELIGDIPLR
jgi:hypothetical protein